MKRWASIIVAIAAACGPTVASVSAQVAAPQPAPQQAYAQAVQARNWPAAIAAAQQMVAASPTAENLAQLAKAQYESGALPDALAAYQRALQACDAEKPAAGTPDDDWRSRTADAYLWQGNTLLKLRRTADAVASYRKAAAIGPHPARALFNICATLYNTGDTAGAVAACHQDLQVDPGKADAWFILGSLLYAGSNLGMSQGKFVISAETRQALQKYLELEPAGAHAADVKAMLDMAAPPQ